MPIGIEGLDQRDFPIAAPVLQLLLARDGPRHIAALFVKDQPFDLMTGGKAVKRPAAMLREAAHGCSSRRYRVCPDDHWP